MNEIKVSTASRKRRHGQRRNLQRRAAANARRGQKSEKGARRPSSAKNEQDKLATKSTYTQTHISDTNKRQVNREGRIW